MRTPEECALLVMAVFKRLCDRPVPKPEGWVAPQLSQGVIREAIGDDLEAGQGIEYALDELWIAEGAETPGMYFVTDIGFLECWPRLEK